MPSRTFYLAQAVTEAVFLLAVFRLVLPEKFGMLSRRIGLAAVGDLTHWMVIPAEGPLYVGLVVTTFAVLLIVSLSSFVPVVTEKLVR